MLLNELSLVEVTNLETHFIQSGLQQGQGTVDFDFGSLGIEAGAKLLDDPTKSILVVMAEPKAIGKKEGQTEAEFTLSIKIRLVFTYPSSYEMKESFVSTNSWYLSSQVRTYFVQYAEAILRQAGIDGIKIPLN